MTIQRIKIMAGMAVLFFCAYYRSYIPFYFHFVPYFFAGPAPKAQCSSGPGFKYCLYGAPQGVAQDTESVLYFLHYAGGSEKSWLFNPISRVYYAEFKRRGLPAPKVVAISYGPYWHLFDKAGPISPGLFANFVDKAMPEIEAKLGGPKRRYLWGMSQGGFNASLLVLKQPDLWSGAVFSCPAWYTISVFSSPQETADFISRTHADPYLVEGGIKIIRERVAGAEEWLRENPLARAALARDLPPVYVDCTTEDDYGFYEGAQRFVETLRSRHQDVVFRKESGGHCELDAREASSFLAGLVARQDLQRALAARDLMR